MSETKEPLRLTVDEHCAMLLAKLDTWSQVSQVLDQETVREVRLAITRSCLLDRMIHHGENPSQTPCPVHQGHWAGIQVGWPGSVQLEVLSDGTTKQLPAPESPTLRKQYDAGCRCFMHHCGCTTGWQPDEACGCGMQTVLGEAR